MNATCLEPLDSFTRRVVRRKAAQLARQRGFTASDLLDLEQGLLLRVLERLPSFDERKAHRNAFVATVVERHAATIVRDRRAPKRDHRRTSSLNATINLPDEGPTELVQTLDERETEARLGVRRRSDQDAVELAEDVATALASLPAPLKELAQRLMRQTISEISRETGVPRSTLNRRVRELRERFDQMGLRDHLAV